MGLVEGPYCADRATATAAPLGGSMVGSLRLRAVDSNGKNMVLQFTPDDREPMLVSCLWSRWTGKDEPDLLSFAAITDEATARSGCCGTQPLHRADQV